MKRFLFGLLLLVATAAPLAALAQDTDDHRKALLWWYTTQRIWLDNPSKYPQPLPDSANLTLGQVQKELAAADKAKKDEGAYDLYNKVESRTKRKLKDAPLDTVLSAILAQLRDGRKGKKSLLQKVDDLEKQFQLVLPTKQDKSPAQASALSGEKADSAQMGATANAPQEITEATGQPSASVEPMQMSFTQRHPRLALLLAGVLGALLGGVAVWWLMRQNAPVPSALRDQDHEPTNSESLEKKRGERQTLREEKKQWEQDKKALNGQILDLNQQIRGLQRANQPAAKHGSQSPPEPLPNAILPAALTVGETVKFAVEQPTPPPPPTRHYAPALETGFLEERQLQAHSLTHLPIEITLDPTNPQRARFGLNPGVEQRLVIDDGVNRLTEFFAFERPIQKPSSLRAGTPGELKREEGGWRVVRKAGLELS